MRDGSNDPNHHGSTPDTFPFSAVVGSDDLALALVLTAVSPEVGGVLVRGEKGTAKSTMVRGLAAVLPHQQVVAGCRFGCAPGEGAGCPDGPHDHTADADTRHARLVELPIGATEDRVVGSLDLERALGRGETAYQPGLLAAANRGILYVDEVNLLHDHLVDLLLDAAAMGRNTVERDGVSVSHAARIVLVGTMNPEEGELRPQLLDRFGLTVEVAAPRDPALRAEVVRRRLAFDDDPAGFVARFTAEQEALRTRIAAARDRLRSVALTDGMLHRIAVVCAGFEVDGLRADIVTARAAVAHAAWSGRTTVTVADVRAAARLALPHRRRRNPFDSPGLDEDLLDQLLGDDEPEPDPDPGDGGQPEPDSREPEEGDTQPQGEDRTPEPAPRQEGQLEPERAPEPQRAEDGQQTEQGEPETEPETEAAPDPSRSGAAAAGVSAADEPYRAKLLRAKGIGQGDPGRRSAALTSTGRRVGSTNTPTGPVHLPATIRAAATRSTAGGRLRVLPGDLRRSVVQGRESNLVLLCVDASGSMAARRRMEAVKSAVLSLLLDAYQRRDKVGLVTFRGAGATLTLPPTGSVDIAARRLRDLPHGGRTPLAEGLETAYDTLRVERLRDPNRRALLVVVTDGRATSGPDALARAARVARQLRHEGVQAVVLDCESGRFRMGLAARLAEQLGADHLPVGELAASAIVGTARAVNGRAA
ncbi:VWA domain-containing protein [Terrabacter sp. MAHUQ-38]|uniref:VWA domain-containing protein n=1 Tax=unclassified Terrabacter TaxID=2630222 RepID=UPI00165E6499|nr:VWA domain-containing protein [Terrabacter sp. MAHUQ-38]MBC9819999.1 VWA domain-containing protein [Terrabacter sp. MAHUQ-38]